MKLSTKTRYGFRSILDLALNHESELVSLKEIAARQQLPYKYLEHVLAMLRTAGLVRSVRGPQGGYALSKPPSQITLRELFDILEGTESFVQCTDDPQVCDRHDMCVTQEVWADMYAACMKVLESTTLEDLAQRARQKRDSSAPMYYI
jgi:Rrf2 family cysteine metabolism transcriptional repressor